MCEKFELYEFQGHYVLFTPSRVKYLKESLSEDIEVYELRHSDQEFEACQIARNIWVNHYGTFLSIGEIDLGEEFTIYFDEEIEMHDLGRLITIDEYREMMFNQRMQLEIKGM